MRRMPQDSPGSSGDPPRGKLRIPSAFSGTSAHPAGFFAGRRSGKQSTRSVLCMRPVSRPMSPRRVGSASGRGIPPPSPVSALDPSRCLMATLPFVLRRREEYGRDIQAHLTGLDYAVVAAYVVAVLAIGFAVSRRKGAREDLFLGGRGFGWFNIGLSIFGTNVSPSMLIASCAIAYEIGIVGGHIEWFAWWFLF